jgi:FAD/FMN-containing dehydrogenase
MAEIRGGLSRREFVARTGAVAAGAMLPQLWLPPGAEAACGAAPPAFPTGISLRRSLFENWSKEIRVDDLWTATPRTAQEVCVLADWARAHRWTLRPRGAMHGWSPLVVGAAATCDDPILLVDTTAYLNRVEIVSTSPGEVRAEAGTLLEDLLARMQDAGLGFTATPCVGAITVGGALAIDGHGASIPAAGEAKRPGEGFGSMSDLVLSITAVVWSPRRARYVLRTLDRADPRCDALMVHLGRAFVTEVRLRAARNQRLRCVSRVDIPAAELFAAPGSRGRTFARLLDATGRAEAIWYPFTDAPWLKLWSVAPVKPASSRQVSAPYNYPFTDNVPDAVAEMADAILTGEPALAPAFGQILYDVTAAGLVATAATDIWGWSKDTLLYLKPTTLRVAELGYGVQTSSTSRARRTRLRSKPGSRRGSRRRSTAPGRWPAPSGRRAGRSTSTALGGRAPPRRSARRMARTAAQRRAGCAPSTRTACSAARWSTGY